MNPKTRSSRTEKTSLPIPDADTLRRILWAMKLTREAERRIEQVLYRQGKIVGGVYVGRGQEAIAAASAVQLGPDDVVLPSHRDFASFLLRGFSLQEMLLNVMARANGPTRGRDNMLHIGRAAERKVIPLISHLGDTVPVACGIALAIKQEKKPGVAVVHFGEGTSSRGDVHEGMNFAAVLNLPVIFICNNNAYAYSTPSENQYRLKDLAERGAAYGMPGVSVDGNDARVIYGEVGKAMARGRANEGPSFIVCNTFRMSGHSAHDAAGYVPRELLKEWEKRDPIVRLEENLIRENIMSPGGVEELNSQVLKEVDEAVAFAESSPMPPSASAPEGVFCGEDCWWERPFHG